MRLIAHRGNLAGPHKDENKPEYILNAIQAGFDVEVDLWRNEKQQLYLGHDSPQYLIDYSFLKSNRKYLWCHAKNLEALAYFVEQDDGLNYFWHENDKYTLTSLGYVWVYPGHPLSFNSIAVKPEKLYSNDELSQCYGICTDNVYDYLRFKS